ncbi:MAG: TonB family protein [Anaeromyxobacter sp.]
MTVPVHTALLGRDRLWPAVAVSVAIHAVAIGVALWKSGQEPILQPQKPITARLVRLGPKKPDRYLPQKDQQAPAPAPAPEAAPAPAPAAPATAAAPRPTPSPAAPAAPRPSTARPATGGGKSGGVSSALARVQAQLDREQWGDPDGDPMGDAEEAEGDPYFALLKRSVEANFEVPTTLSDRERLFVFAEARLWIDAAGRVSRWKIDRSSGNPTFDAAVERTIRKTPQVPPPPQNVRQQYPDGIPFRFDAKSNS